MLCIKARKPLDRLIDIVGHVVHVVTAGAFDHEEVFLGRRGKRKEASTRFILARRSAPPAHNDLKRLGQQRWYKVERVEAE